MAFDSSKAWRDAAAAISANRDVALAIAGVFFLIPGLALALFYPQPVQQAGMDEQAMMKMASDYYVSILPVMIPMVVFQAIGTLGLLVLLTDRSRPTVGQALGTGTRGVVAYVLSQLLMGLGIGLVGGLLAAIAAVTGVAAIAVVAVAAMLVIAVFVAIRTSLTAPVIAIEGERNPVAALRRSWDLTRGHAGRMGLFYLLVGIAFLVAIMVATAILGILFGLAFGPTGASTGGAVVGSALQAVMALYFVAIIAAIYRQLAGPAAGDVTATFE